MVQAQKHQKHKETAEEQRIGWTVWRATHSGKSVKPELKKWAAGLVPYSEKAGLEDFLRNPEGKEFVMFFKNEEDANALATLVNNSGLTTNVNAEIHEISGARIKLTLTVQKKKRIAKLPPRQQEMYKMVKAGEWRKPREEDELTNMADEGLGDVGPLGEPTGSLFGSGVPAKAEVVPKKAEKAVNWKRFVRRPEDYDGDKVSLFPSDLRKKRKEELLKGLNGVIKAINHRESYGITNEAGKTDQIIDNGRSIKPFTIEVRPLLAKFMFGGEGPRAKKWLESRGLKPEWVEVNGNLVTIDTRKSKKRSGKTRAEREEAAAKAYQEALAFLRGGRTF